MRKVSESLVSDYSLIPNHKLVSYITTKIRPNTEEYNWIYLQRKKPLHSGIAAKLNLISMQTCGVVHTNTSFGVKLCINQEKNGKTTPFSVTFSGDTKPSDNLRKLGMNSTLLIHEATFDDSLTHSADLARHCTISQALEQCSAMKPDYAILTHFSSQYQIPLIGKPLPKNHGVAMDNMELVESDLPMLSGIFSTLKIINGI